MNILFQKKHLKKSMLKNLILRIFCYIISLGYTPLLLKYLGIEKYGIWATILSIIAWVSFCDVGIGSGLRNILTKELAEERLDEVKKSVSTAYIIISIIALVVTIVTSVLTFTLNWRGLLNTSYDLRMVLFISFLGIILSLLLGLGKSILFALQLSENVILLELVTNIIQFIGVVILYLFTKPNLLYVSLLFSLSSFVVCFSNCAILAMKYKFLAPSIKYYDKGKTNSILNRGVIFLILQLGGIAMNSTDNVLVSFFYGPSSVTPYSSMTRLFYAVISLYISLIAPIWARTAVACVSNDYLWIKKTVLKLSTLMALYSLVIILVGFFYKPLSFIWLREELKYEKYLISITVFSSIFEMATAMLSNILNGMDILKIQAKIAAFQIITNIPLSILFAKILGCGVVGVKISTMLLFFTSTVFYYLVVFKHINRNFKKGSQISI